LSAGVLGGDKAQIVTLPVLGSTSTSQNWVEKPGAMPPALTEAPLG